MNRLIFYIFIISTITVFTVMALMKWSRATNPHFSLGEWDGSSIWWQQDKCSECHKPLDETKTIAIDSSKGSASSPPISHQNPNWESHHGRVKAVKRTGCFACHQVSTCDSCHSIVPKTHTIGFSKPDGLSIGAQRHALLARLRPSSCLLCHQNLFTDCTGCHSPGEISSLVKAGEKELKKWPQFHDTFKRKAL